uniref:Uncharacterized protein n=1 Tax=Timema cristinae TaxID=61476 RepID=A0A7R9HG00_TIMCR|nr:unnamed protein product [Timema cristinae]
MELPLNIQNGGASLKYLVTKRCELVAPAGSPGGALYEERRSPGEASHGPTHTFPRGTFPETAPLASRTL